MLKKSAFYILLVGFLFSYTLQAQVFPVTVTPQIIPPYSLKLSEYNTASSDKLILNLLLTDITESNRQVRLKFYVENNAGLSIQSNDVVIGANPIFLDGGVPLRLTNIDLQPYFALQNLRGINPQQYSVPLPEGLYRFCFEVYDAQSGQQISRKSCATVYLVLNDPPFLNLPNRGEQVLMRDPQNVIFQWTPRHLNATNVEYEFTLAEIWDNQMDPQAAFLASRPLYQTNTFATTLLYGPAETSLLPDKTYGWRVRAMISDGISETSVFKNDGYSEIYYFTYTGKCAEPEYILAEAKNTTSEKILWQGVDHLRYNVQYRKKDTENAIWFEGGTINEYTTIYNLEPGTTYEFRVGGQCLDNGPFTYSQIYEFTTTLTPNEKATYNCGIKPEIVITNQDPLEVLVVNEVFTAGDFPVTVKEVKGDNGSFSGWGYIVVPYLQDTKLKVSFDNISINTDYQLLDGIVVTDYDENWEGIESVNDVTEVFEGDNDLEAVRLDYDITINDIRVNDDGTITVTDPVTGAISKYPGGDDVVIVDSNGDVYHVDEDGNITQGEPLADGGGVDSENTPGVDENGDVSQLSAEGIKVEFIDDNSYAYGFDAIPDGQEKQLGKYYGQIKDVEGKPYAIINKAIGNGASDKIKAKVTITDSNLSIKDLVIKTANGENVKYEVSGSNEITLELNGYYAFEHENIYATIQSKDNTKQQTIAGVFSLWHLSKKDVNVTIIPVDGVSLPSKSELLSKVNAIFGKASVNIDFTIASDFKVDKSLYGGDTVQMGDSGFFSNYTEDQNAIIKAYKSSITTSRESYYLFVFGSNIQPSRSDVAGFMPIKRQFGFIFNGNLSKEEEGKGNLAGTVAHELGHGVFGLEHPFTELKTAKGATNWLMDYGNGVELSHLDWAQIHNPDFKLYPFQDDEEGELFSGFDGDDESLHKIFQIIRYAYENSKEVNTLDPFSTSVFGKKDKVVYGRWKGDGIYVYIGNGVMEGTTLQDPIKRTGKLITDKVKEERFALLFNNVEIYIPRRTSGADGNGLKRLKEYLFPKAKTDISDDLSVVLEIEEHLTGGVYYELNFKTKDEDHIFKFEHHDEVEKFSNALKIERDKEYVVSNKSEYSKQIIKYLNDNFNSEAYGDPDCDNIDTYFSEIPSDYLTVANNTTNFNYEHLWRVLDWLLNCSVNDIGVSEEDAVIAVVEALARTDGDKFLKEIRSRKINDNSAFRELYDDIDDWGGKDNFTKIINIIYKVWKNSKYNSGMVYDIPYESSKSGVFYLSDYEVKFKDDKTDIEFIEYVPTYRYDDYGNSHEAAPEPVVRGTYDIYDPIRLVNYNKIASSGIEVKSTKVPMFILKAIDEKYRTSNTEQGINLVFEVALTATGIGNLTKLRHLKNLSKLDEFFIGLQHVDALVGVTNIVLKYSDYCATPDGMLKTKKGMDFCQKFAVLGDILGSINGAADFTKRIKELDKLSQGLIDDVDKNPDLLKRGMTKTEFNKVMRVLRRKIEDKELAQLWKLHENGALKTAFKDFQNFQFLLSSTETLLKYSKTCDVDETCKEIRAYLGYLQTTIKAKGLGVSIVYKARTLSKAIKEDSKTLNKLLKDNQDVISNIDEVGSGVTPSLKTFLNNSKDVNSKVKQMYDEASEIRKSELEESWRILEFFENTRFANDGKNLEILAKTYSRFVYNNKESFEGLKALMVEGSAANKQKLIDGFEEANKIFDSKLELPIKFSGIKKGDVIITTIINGKNQEIARIDKNGILVKKKFLDEADGAEVVGKYKEDVILRKGKEIGFKRSSNVPNNAKYNASVINSLKNGFSDDIASILNKHGISVENFQKIYQKMKFHQLKPKDQDLIMKIRNSIPMPDENTILQKVIPKDDLNKYLKAGGYTKVGGFITRAKDAKHLKTYEDIFHGMRLDYKGSKFNLSDGYCIIIRYKAKKPNLAIPIGAGQPYPYTGNGLTSGNNGRLGVPELKSSLETPDDGAGMFKQDSEGVETLIAVFSASENRFIKVEE
ncbi:TANFOR domain-containing protein [Aquimarina sp. MAR_2010_214]|uniref:hypothetical protein n=1 Tax=Aquimarina sp. MAR_2010_214 TaxID=1250026 RepID=UPI000CCB7830|nr:hypothetical protein [Aquimarina sp. MAR_2010_214]PKV50783.1 TANFOR domain-containing protein [Aquimarina sp. MAR_2010_214]